MVLSKHSDVKHGSQKLAVCSNFVTLHHYSTARAAIEQHFVLNTVLQNNSNLLKLHYAVAAV